jgi:hypothetical protein
VPESIEEDNFSDAAENEAEISTAPVENAAAENPLHDAVPPAATDVGSEPKKLPPLRPDRERPDRPERPDRADRPERPERPDRRVVELRRPKPVYVKPAPVPYVKPAEFRPAETSAIHEAVSHATEIAAQLKHMTDQLDEILELVEVAERQKLADEREIDELRRALRRIQPPRQQPQHHSPEQHRGHSREESRPRREEPRNQQQNPPPDSVETHEPEISGEEPPTRLE